MQENRDTVVRMSSIQLEDEDGDDDDDDDDGGEMEESEAPGRILTARHTDLHTHTSLSLQT